MSEPVAEFQEKSEIKDDESFEYQDNIIYEEEESISELDPDEIKGISEMGPFVEYIYDENESVEYKDHEYTQVKYNDDADGVEDTSTIENEENSNDYIEPMPFFLSTSHVFSTDENDDQNEGETIILQIDNDDEEDNIKAIPDEVRAASLQLLLCSNKTNSILDTYTCEVCFSSYGCLNCLKSHYETMHLGNTYISHYKCKYSTSTTKGLYCPVCELTFDTRNDTMDHYITHAVACEICGSGFDRQLHLTEHLRKVHNKGDFDLLYDCELCRITYQYANGLNKHYQKMHKLILCVECKLRFGDVSDLQEHEKTHRQKVDVLPYACSKCDKAFAEISDIAVHIRLDHNHKRKADQFETVYVISHIKSEDKKPTKKKVVRVKKRV